MKFNALVRDGKANVYHKAEMASWIASMEGKEITIEITKTKIKKTIRQNNGIYLLIDYFTTYLNESTGNNLSPDDVKKIIKTERHMIEQVYDKNSGRFITDRFRSFGDLSLTEASELIAWFYAYSINEWNIQLPELKQIE